MDDSRNSRPSIAIAIERNLLRRLCQAGGIAIVPPGDLRALRHYQWASPDHEVVFDALLRLANIPAASLRARLPIETTRMGFPDMHWDLYFESNKSAPELPSNETVSKLVSEMIAESAHRQ